MVTCYAITLLYLISILLLVELFCENIFLMVDTKTYIKAIINMTALLLDLNHSCDMLAFHVNIIGFTVCYLLLSNMQFRV